MTDFKANVYVRCMGLLYFRFVGDPERLWAFMGRLIDNDERSRFLLQDFPVSSDGEVILRLSEYIERLLSDGDYFGTRLPRIPTIVERDLKEKLEAAAERRERREWNAEHLGEFTEGSLLSVFSAQVT